MKYERSYPTWIITQQHGMVPDRKGPFYSNKRVEEFLREAYQTYPGCICIVIDGPIDNAWSPQHGYEWLDINGDKRRRHPRTVEQENKPIGYLRHRDLAALGEGSCSLHRRRDWQANIPVYAYPSPSTKVTGH